MPIRTGQQSVIQNEQIIQRPQKIAMPIDLNAAPSEDEDAILDLNLCATIEDGEGAGIYGEVVQAVEDQIHQVEDCDPAVHSSNDLNLPLGKFYFVVVTVL